MLLDMQETEEEKQARMRVIFEKYDEAGGGTLAAADDPTPDHVEIVAHPLVHDDVVKRVADDGAGAGGGWCGRWFWRSMCCCW